MKFLITVFLLSLIVSCKSKEKSSAFYMPAEWEVQDAVWFGWVGEDSSAHPPVIEMIKALLPTTKIKLAADNDSLLATAKLVLSKGGIDTNSITFYTMPGERYWIRDHGATYLVNEKGELAVLDFSWNMYAVKDWLLKKYNNNADSAEVYYKRFANPNTARVDSMMAAKENLPIINTDIIMEGGGIEVNGKGTLLLNEVLTMQRNSGKTMAQLEEGFRKALGVSKIIWVKDGLLEDSHMFQLHFGKYVTLGTGGHLDDYVRFADPHTILLAWVDENEINAHPFNKVNDERMRKNYEILSKATDQDGKPFRIIKVPMPDPIERPKYVKTQPGPEEKNAIRPGSFLPDQQPKEGDTLINVAAATYLNYHVGNGVVLVPGYADAGSSAEEEKRVEAIFQKVFPGRKIIFINCLSQNWQGGGIHCSTQQQPKRK